jgi:hypothetical protein
LYASTLLAVVGQATNLDNAKRRNAIYDMQILALAVAQNEVLGKPVLIVTGDRAMRDAAMAAGIAMGTVNLD